MVMRSCRDFPLVGIVEFIMYGCMKYFRECYMAASINISNPQIQFCTRVTQYMQQKIEKVKLHRVISTGTMEQRFEVLCKDRSGRGIRRDRVVQESLTTVDGRYVMKYNCLSLMYSSVFLCFDNFIFLQVT